MKGREFSLTPGTRKPPVSARGVVSAVGLARGPSAQGVPRSALSVHTAPHARVAFGASPSPRRPVRQLFLLGPLVSCHSPQEHTQKAVYAGRASGQTQAALRGPFRGGWAQQQSSAWGFEEPRPSRAAVAARRLVAPWFLLLFPGP